VSDVLISCIMGSTKHPTSYLLISNTLFVDPVDADRPQEHVILGVKQCKHRVDGTGQPSVEASGGACVSRVQV
jgi:hypothetical protein